MSRSHRSTLALALAALGVAAGPALAGGTLEVPGPLDLTIQEAIDIAESLGVTQLNIAPGVYAESIVLPDNGYDLVLMGNPTNPGQVVINPSLAGVNDSAVHVVHGQSSATQLVGLTLTGGNADGIDDGDGAPLSDDRGGALYVNGSDVTVVDCVLTGNDSTFVGGAVYINSGTVLFTRCVIDDCESDIGGGAYTNESTVTFSDCAFSGNVAAAGTGGAISAHGASALALLRCHFEGNSASSDGGALWTNSPTTISACTVLANDTGNLGGGVHVGALTTTVRDSVFNGNTSTTGGAAYSVSGATVVLVNCTLTHNVGTVGGVTGGGAKTIRNGIIWGNAGSAIGVPATVTYTLVQGGFAGAGNVNVNPMFVNALGLDATAGTDDDDLRLQAGSPAIDAGDASAVIGQYPVDLDGNPRGLNDPDTADTGIAVLAIAVDMGAYEFQPAGGSPACPGDIDGSGSVGITDLLDLLAGWGPCR